MVVLVFILVFAFCWDVYLASTSRPGDTISEAIVFLGQRSSGAVLLLGIVLGHLLWPQVIYVRPDSAIVKDALEKLP